MNITSSKHSSGLNFNSCRRTDKYKHLYKHLYKHSRMTIATSGTHLSAQHDVGGRDGGGRDVGGPCGGG